MGKEGTMRSFMKCACLAAALCAFIGCLRTKAPDRAVIPAAAASGFFKEARQLCGADGGALWGRSLCGPMMFADPATRQAVCNVQVQGAVRDGDVYRLTLPESTGVANTDVEFEGRHWTMVMWPLPKDATRRRILLMHESYHRIQKDLGLEARGGLGQNGHLDTKEGRIWFRAELHALKAALSSSGESRNLALDDALLFRAYRRSKWPEAAAQERNLELNEGLAESTGIDAALKDPRERLRAALYDVENCERAPSYVRSFAYATGPAYAEFLNAVDPGWRRNVTRDFDFGAAAARAYHIQVPVPHKAEVLDALTRYNGSEITAQENVRQAKVDARNRLYTAAFLDGPVVIFPLNQMSISFNPRSVNTFEGHGRVYGTLEVRDVWGSLEVVSGGALITPSMKEVIVPAEKKVGPGRPAGEHWSAKLNQGYSLVRDPQRPGSFRLEKRPAR
jgi:hypothetical protein